MALTKEVVIDKIEVLEDGTIQTREETRILEDGVIISRAYTNRTVIEPGQDVTEEIQKVKDIVAVVHTKPIVDDYKAKILATKIASGIPVEEPVPEPEIKD